MKRIILLFIAVNFTVCVMAQQKPSLTKAYNYYYDKDYVKAKEAVDVCAADSKLSGKAQTWLYKGNIYYFLANQEYTAKQKNEQYLIRYPDAPIEAYDAFIKSQEINANMEAMDMFTAKQALSQLYPLLLVRGVDQLIAKDYASAKSTLAKGIASYETDKPQYPMHGDLYYYYAYTIESMGDTAGVKEAYTKAIADGSTNTYVYVRLIEAYKKDNNKVMIQSLLSNGKKNLPDNINIRIAEIDYLYWDGDSLQAQSLLNQLPTQELKTADEFVNVANFYIKEKRYEEAMHLLTNANQLSGGNFVVLYNLGVCLYSISEQYFKQYNESALNNDSQATQYKAQSEDYLYKAAQYFEQARVMEPTDLNLLYTLKSIYIRQQSPKANDIDKEINKLNSK